MRKLIALLLLLAASSASAVTLDPYFNMTKSVGTKKMRVNLGGTMHTYFDANASTPSLVMRASSFTATASTITVTSGEGCDGFDCLIVSTNITEAKNYLSIAGLSYATQTYRLEIALINDDYDSGDLTLTVFNSSVGAQGYTSRSEKRSSGGTDADDSNTEESGFPCSLVQTGDAWEDDAPGLAFLGSYRILLMNNKMMLVGKSMYNNNGDGTEHSELDVSCTFNDTTSGAVRPNITDLQIKTSSQFKGKVRLFRENL